MRFTISDETGMTSLEMLTGMCFTGPLLAGILLAPKAAGVVVFMIGIGVGLGAGVLAAYAMRRTVEYWDKLEPRLKSQPWVVKKLVIKGLQVLGVFRMFGPTFMMIHLMKFIVQQMAG